MSRDWTPEELQAASAAMKAAGHMGYEEFCEEIRRQTPITKVSDHIKVEGHIGTWHSIDEGDFILTPDTDDGRPLTLPAHLFLLEHDKYGDEAACVIVDEAGKLVLEDVWNGFDDLLEAGWARAGAESV